MKAWHHILPMAGIFLMAWSGLSQAQMMSSEDADRWYKEGIFPSIVTVPVEKLPSPGTLVLIPFPGLALKSGNGWPECWAYPFNSSVTDGSGGFTIGPNSSVRFPVDHIWCNGFSDGLEFSVKPGMVFPLYEGKVYRVEIDGQYLSLVCVNEMLPESILPLPDSRCLSGNFREAVFSCHRMNSPKFMNPRYCVSAR